MLGTEGGARCARRALVSAIAGTCLALVLAAAAQAQGRVIADDFSQDRLASDYVVHAGGPMDVDDGVLRATTETPDRVITHNASGGLVDTEFTLKVNFKANASSGTTAAIVKFQDAGNYLRLATTYSSSSIKVTKRDNGVATDLFSEGGLFALSPNTSYWVRTRIQGNDTTVELWGSDPQLGGAPIVSRGYTLTGPDATKFGAGVAGQAGIYLDPNETAREFDDLRIAEIVAPPPPPPTPPPTPPPPPPTGPCSARAEGTDGRDRLTGTPGGDFITALAGNDVVRALTGDDCVFGGPGYDRLYGAGGDDTLRGGSGVGHMRGGSGDDRLYGRGRADLAWGGSGADRISTGSGGDALWGGSGADELIAGDGRDLIVGGSGRDRVYAGAGRDRVDVAGGGRDRVTCGSGRDVIRADRRDRVSRNCERVIYVR